MRLKVAHNQQNEASNEYGLMQYQQKEWINFFFPMKFVIIMMWNANIPKMNKFPTICCIFAPPIRKDLVAQLDRATAF